VLGGQWIVGVVGQLQLEVLASRIATEYKVAVDFEAAPFELARWIAGDETVLKRFTAQYRDHMANDRDEAPVFLARSIWELDRAIDKFPELKFLKTRERA
jgi:peptide chain release factor 3